MAATAGKTASRRAQRPLFQRYRMSTGDHTTPSADGDPRDDAEPGGLSSSDVRERTLSGVRWVVLARIAGESVALIAAVVLARLLTPAAFGRAAVPLILAPLAVILTFEGFASVLVQRESITREDCRAAAFLSAAAGIVLTAATIVLAPLIAAPIFGEETARLFQLIAPVFLLAGFGAVPRALLWRDLDFRKMGLIEAASLAAGAATSVGLAIAGVGAASIVGGALAVGAVSLVLMQLSAPFHRPWPVRSAMPGIVRFGAPASLAGLVHVGFQNVDYAILAARLTAAQAGFYWRAFQLGVVYQDKVSGIMLRMSFPVYSRTRDAARLRLLHQRATRVHAVVVFPLLTLLIITAGDLVPAVFGSAWIPSVGPTRILALAGMISAALTGYPQVMLAVGRPRRLLHFNLVVLAVYASAVALAAGHGLTAVCWTVTGVYVGLLFAVYGLLLGPVAGIGIRRIPGDLAPAVAGCLVLAAVGVTVRTALARAGVPALPTVALVSLASLPPYAFALSRMFPPAWADVLLIIERVIPARALPAALRAAAPPAEVPLPSPR